MIFKIIACNPDLLTGIQNKLNKNRIINDKDICFKSTGSTDFLSNINLSKNTSIRVSTKGEAIVLFLKIEDKNYVVKMLNSDHYMELFGLKFAEQLGFNTPKFIAVELDSKSGQTLFDKTLDLLKTYEVTQKDIKSYNNKLNRMEEISSSKNMNYVFLIMEYMPGISLDELRDNKVLPCLNKNTCEELGKIFIMDVFIDNNDRMRINPLKGTNPENIMFYKDDQNQGMCVIDTEFFPLSPDPMFQGMKSPLEIRINLIEELIENITLKENSSEAVNNFKKIFKDYSSVILEDSLLTAFREGVLKGVVNISDKITDNSIQELAQEMIIKLEKLPGYDDHNYDDCDFSAHIDQMCKFFLEAGRKIKASNPSIFNE